MMLRTNLSAQVRAAIALGCMFMAMGTVSAQTGPTGASRIRVSEILDPAYIARAYLGLPRTDTATGIVSWDRASTDNPILGGITYRTGGGAPSLPDIPGSNFLRSWRAQDLFEILNPPTIENWAMMRGLNPRDEATRQRYVEDVSRNLDQLFILKSLGGVLDEESILRRLPQEVPEARLEYALRRILEYGLDELDASAIGGWVLNQFLEVMMSQGEPSEDGGTASSDASAALLRVGIPADLSSAGLTLGFHSPEFSAAFQRFLPGFRRDMTAIARDPEHRVPAGRSLPQFSSLPAELQRIFARPDLGARAGLEEKYARLRAAIGRSPYRFEIQWTQAEASGDERLTAIQREFEGRWRPVVIAGQERDGDPRNDLPRSVEEFRRLVERKLLPAHKQILRQRVADLWIFRAPGNGDLLNPNPPRRDADELDQFNPFGRLRLGVRADELAHAYEVIKDSAAALPTRNFHLYEIRLGSAQDVASGATPGTPSPCVQVFNEAFLGVFEAQSRQVVARIHAPGVSTAQFDDGIRQARSSVVPAAFAAGEQALRAEPAEGRPDCRQFAAALEDLPVTASNSADGLSERERARWLFARAMVSEDQNGAGLRDSLLPKVSLRDRAGNVTHLFFQRREVLYVPYDSETPLDPRIEAILRQENVRDPAGRPVTAGRLRERVSREVQFQAAMERLITIYEEVVPRMISSRYRIRARSMPFSYNGMDGFSLQANDARPATWIHSLFTSEGPQNQQELLITRTVPRRSLENFRRAYLVP